MNIGGIVIEPVLDGRILSAAWDALAPPDSPSMADQDGMVHPDGLVESTLGGFLVRSADRVVLVDAGGGQPIPGGYVPPTIDFDDPDDPIAGSLRARGLEAGELADAIVADLRAGDIVQGGLPDSSAATA